jgi:hypothetical protein
LAKLSVLAALSFLRRRKTAFQLCFGSPAGKEVLIDLAKFCRAAETCVVAGDHDKTLLLEGRREVWLRIGQHLRLNQEQLFSLYAGQHYIDDKGDNNADA